LLAGCFKNPGAPDAELQLPAPRVELQPDRLQIIDDPAVLASRVTWTSVPLFIEAKETPRQELVGKSQSSGLTMVAEVLSPDVDGNLVQANDIDIRGTNALVAFNYAGNVFAGAVQVLDFRIADQPRLIAEIVYNNADVTAVCFNGNNIYVGLGSDDPALTSGAMMEEFTLIGNRVESTGRWVDLPSGVVTDLGAMGGHVVATVGAEGGGVARIGLGNGDLQVEAFSSEDDLRGFDFVSSSEIVAVCGTNPRMGSLDFLSMSGSMAAIDGFQNPAAKGTVEVYKNLCWLGSGDGGFQVRNATGGLVARLANAEFSDERPDLMIANAVTVSGSRAYVAAGALGVQVVDVSKVQNNDEDMAMYAIGELSFPDGVSSNMIQVRGNIMVVAAGVGGVKLIRMSNSRDDD
jgi:hypothetical protein